MLFKKKVLFIVLEGESASGICVKNVAKVFVDKQYWVDIVSYGKREFSEETEFGRCFYINKPFLLRVMSATKDRFKVCYTCVKTLDLIIKMTLYAICWPCDNLLYTFSLMKKIGVLHNRNTYDFIIPIYTQIYPLIAVHLLRKKYNDFKFIPYFLDSLSGGPIPKVLTNKRKIKLGLQWERKILKNADIIIMMMSSKDHQHRYNYNQSYYERIKFLDIPMLKMINNARSFAHQEGEMTYLVYVGTLPFSLRNPMYGLEILSGLRNINIKMIGPIPEKREYIEFCDSHPNITLVGEVGHDKVEEFIRCADILLNFGNNFAGMVPSKIFEYISYGKPILSFSPSNEDPSIGYLEKYNNACIVREWENRDENISIVCNFISMRERNIICSDEIKDAFKLNMPEQFFYTITGD